MSSWNGSVVSAARRRLCAGKWVHRARVSNVLLKSCGRKFDKSDAGIARAREDGSSEDRCTMPPRDRRFQSPSGERGWNSATPPCRRASVLGAPLVRPDGNRNVPITHVRGGILHRVAVPRRSWLSGVAGHLDISTSPHTTTPFRKGSGALGLGNPDHRTRSTGSDRVPG